jgi:hypothetical protein
LQGGNKPAYMALSVKLVAPDSTRPALHVGIENDSARNKIVKKVSFASVTCSDLRSSTRAASILTNQMLHMDH